MTGTAGQTAPRLLRRHRIGIVGAGPAGVHLAHLLKQRGFDRVTVLERDTRVGGKSLSVVHDGTVFEMGACYVPSNYDEYRRLLARYDAGRVVSPPALARDVVTAAFSGSLTTYSLDAWIGHLTDRLIRSGTLRPGGAVRRLIDALGAVRRLVAERNRLLGRGYYPLSDRPTPGALRELAAPFGELMERCRLQILEPFFRLATSAQGYGVLETSPSFYPLLWNERRFVMSFILTRLGLTRRPIVSAVDRGSQSLFTSIAARDQLDIRLGCEVVSIERPGGGRPVAVTLRTENGAAEERFDQIILSGDLRGSLGYLAQPNDDEQRIFGRFLHSSFVTTLFKASRWPATAYALNVADALTPNPTLSVSGVRERRFLAPAANTGPALGVAYQFRQDAHDPAVLADLDQRFAPEMRQLGFADLSIVQRCRWAYCPHFPAAAVAEGLPWDIFAMQGRHDTWYAGSSASFESLNDVMKYNVLLLRHYAE